MFKRKSIAFLMVGLLALGSLYTTPVKAQTEGETILVVDTAKASVVSPLFTGNEKNLVDTLLAYGKAATDPEFKAVVSDAVKTIKETPKEGGIDAWYAYALAVITSITAIYQYIRAKTAKEKAQRAGIS